MLFCRRRFFTLIELLIVVAVISILAGMLLPALNQAREKGRSVSCMNNMKTIGLANTAYMTDSDDYIVPSTASPFGAGGYSREYVWYGILGGLGNNSNYGINFKLADISNLEGNISGSGTLTCPSETKGYGSEWEGGFAHYMLSCGLTGSYSSSGTINQNAYRKFSAVKHPSITVFCMENLAKGSYASLLVTGISYRHGTYDVRTEVSTSTGIDQFYYLKGRANITFIDGHVASKTLRDMDKGSQYAAVYSSDISVCGYDRTKGALNK